VGATGEIETLARREALSTDTKPKPNTQGNA